MKILTYNLNGIRSAIKKDWLNWLGANQADIVCIQELKAQTDQIPQAELEKMGYHCYWMPAQKKGYSGVAILTKTKPNHVEYGCGIEKYDFEGRVIRADFDSFSIISVYFPSGSSGDERQSVKMDFLNDMYIFLNKLRKDFPNLIVSGDFNICHKTIDIHDPANNKNSSGFLPEERIWMDNFVESGFVDSFRVFHPYEPHHYTWWSFRAAARSKNKGWRIDYHFVSEPMKDRLKSCEILPQAVHSDHCPILLEI
jgi:exodeoxyribonuclease-3